MNLVKALECFKAYDVRGKLGEEFNQKIAYRIGRATAQTLRAKTVVIGFDARESSPILAQAAIRGICDAGADVLEIGLAGTEEMYAAVSEFKAGAGIQITASHNPIEYNGMKFVKKGSQPLSEQDFLQIKYLTEIGNFLVTGNYGSVIDLKEKARDTYLRKVIEFVDLECLMPLKIVINSGNGAAGPTLDALNNKLREKGVDTNFVYICHDPDASFPNGIPNPLLEETRHLTADAVVRENADFGVAFDGDFDRCFLFDHLGNFISSEYLVGLLAQVFLLKERGATIVYDPRVVWNTMNMIKKCGGQSVTSKAGHTYVKSTMRASKAIYGGEMSAHHYFRDFDYCDSGMIPWLLIWETLSTKTIRLSSLIAERKTYFPSSGEINFKVSNSTKCLLMVRDFYSTGSTAIDELDGLSISFKKWRFNLRKSNTEPFVRLNIETKGDELLLRAKIEELTEFITAID